ncbi:MAG: methyltransferase domain-containing protein [Myxococcales bacterium]|nr:methyltransferase domain-containing protein [Myxococcales bacterium]MDH3485761.1 methyltransferase domain-containing protein [Myxococcales bacterium]
MSAGYRGYIASRPVRGEMTPQHVQNLVVRDYATRNGLPFLLSATEYAMPGCFMMLDSAVASLDDIDGIIFFSLFMMPPDEAGRRRIYRRTLELGRSLHFALENLAFDSERDIDRLEDMFQVDRFARSTLRAVNFDSEVVCPICGGLPASETSVDFSGVTSDVKPWPHVSNLLVCGGCGLLHKRKTAEWFQDVDVIYRDYEAYHQGQGAEQSVRQEEASELSPRSALLVRFAKDELALPSSGRLLDVGCGNGALLRSFAGEFPGWELIGVDRSESGADAVGAIPGVERFVVGGPADAPGRYDLISLVHVLEHVPEPLAFLSEVAAKLTPEGAVLIDAPSFATNPFDLAVVDHVMHFSLATLRELTRRSGYALRAYSSSLIRKEHAALLTLADGLVSTDSRASRTPDGATDAVSLLQGLATWLPQRFADQEIGILGTGIAATWVCEQLSNGAAYFVDEDPHRFGKSYMATPVIAPTDVPDDLTVFVAQPPAIARRIAERLATEFPGPSWVPCPSLDELEL